MHTIMPQAASPPAAGERTAYGFGDAARHDIKKTGPHHEARLARTGNAALSETTRATYHGIAMCGDVPAEHIQDTKFSHPLLRSAPMPGDCGQPAIASSNRVQVVTGRW